MNEPGTSRSATVFAAAVQAHRVGDLTQAEQLYRQVLQQDPTNAEALHLLGLVCFQTKRLVEAIDLMRDAVDLDGTNSEYRANLGTALQTQGHLDEAIEQFQLALDLEPDSWQLHHNLGNALQQRGELDGAVKHYRQALQINPACVEASTNLGVVLLRQGQPKAAIEPLERARQRKPDSVLIQYNLAKALQQIGQLDEAVANYREVIQSQPAFIDAHIELARALRDLGELGSAIDCLQKVLQQHPHDGKVLRVLSELLRDHGDLDEAVGCIRTIINKNPQSAEAHLNLGLTLEDQGKLDEAQHCYREALRLKPSFVEAMVGEAGILEKKGQIENACEIVSPLAHAKDANVSAIVLHAKLLRQLGNTEDSVKQIEQLLHVRDLSTKWRIIAHTDLGQAYDSVGRYDEAFAHFRQANDMKPGNFDAERHARLIDDVIAAFDREQMARLPRASDSELLPAFIVGMPRSGTSLVEQMLASHPRICGAGELADIETMTSRLPQTLRSKTPFPGCVGQLTQQTVDGLAARYLMRLREFSLTAERVTDKMPHNYLHIGFIRLLFPRAAIIHCRRDPRDTCLSCYFANFLPSQTFANDLRGLGKYYSQYDRLMHHWVQTLETPIFEISYEDLVREPEPLCRTLIAYLQVEWDERCLNYHQSGRYMNTASYQQVRQPIYTKSVGRWRNYEKFIGPMIEALARST